MALPAQPAVPFSLPSPRLRAEANPQRLSLGSAGPAGSRSRGEHLIPGGGEQAAGQPGKDPAYSVMRLASSVQAAVELAEKTR